MPDDAKRRLVKALLGPQYDPKDDPEFQRRASGLAGVLIGYAAGSGRGLKRNAGRPPKSEGEQKWNTPRYTQLWADIELLKARGMTEMAACKHIARKAHYRERYPRESHSTLRRRWADARKAVHNKMANTIVRPDDDELGREIGLFVLRKNYALEYCEKDFDRDCVRLTKFLRAK
jgi:hypothetical protein